MNNLGYPYTPVHPGALIKEELECRGISQKHFAKVVGLSYVVFNDILNEKRPMSTDLALILEATLGINADLLVDIQTQYNLQTARQDEGNITRLDSLRKICASLL